MTAGSGASGWDGPAIESDSAGATGDLVPDGGLVAVLAPKGGAGATTVAVNLTVALADGAPAAPDRPPVAVVVDADVQFGDVALLAGVDPQRSLASLLRDPRGLSSAPPDATSVGRTLLGVPGTAAALMAAPIDPALADALPVGFLGGVLDILSGLAAWVIVDLPSTIDDRAMEVLDRAGSIVVVTSADPLAVKDTLAAVDLLERLGLGDRWLVVSNAPTPETGVGVSVLEQHLGRRVAATIPHDPAAPAAVLRGSPLVIDNPAAPAARALAGLAGTLRQPPSTGGGPSSPLRHAVARLVNGFWRPTTSGTEG